VPKACVYFILRSITHWSKRSVNEKIYKLVVKQKNAMKWYKLN